MSTFEDFERYRTSPAAQMDRVEHVALMERIIALGMASKLAQARGEAEHAFEHAKELQTLLESLGPDELLTVALDAIASLIQQALIDQGVDPRGFE